MAKKRVMQPKPSRPALTADDIEVGKHYRAKRPQNDFFGNIANDRTVKYIGQFSGKVQYDSDTVATGRKLPMVTMEAFLKWASHEVF